MPYFMSMRTRYIALAVGVIVLAGAAVWYTRDDSGTPEDMPLTYGEYAYTCDSGVEFMLTLSPDFNSVTIQPVVGAAYPTESRLFESPTDTGRRYRSGEYEMHGQGERVTLYDTATQKTYSCEPQPKPDEAPLNFGD